jgi:hypothetical protein
VALCVFLNFLGWPTMPPEGQKQWGHDSLAAYYIDSSDIGRVGVCRLSTPFSSGSLVPTRRRGKGSSTSVLVHLPDQELFICIPGPKSHLGNVCVHRFSLALIGLLMAPGSHVIKMSWSQPLLGFRSILVGSLQHS